MSCYLIRYIDSNISISEYEDDEFIALKNKGEESWRYDFSFWDWFKDKIEYEGEELCFIVVSDGEFMIDNSINIAPIHILSEEIIVDIIDEYDSVNQQINLFPKANFDIPKKQVLKQTLQPRKTQRTSRNKKSLQKYFKKQTAKHKKSR